MLKRSPATIQALVDYLIANEFTDPSNGIRIADINDPSQGTGYVDRVHLSRNKIYNLFSGLGNRNANYDLRIGNALLLANNRIAPAVNYTPPTGLQKIRAGVVIYFDQNVFDVTSDTILNDWVADQRIFRSSRATVDRVKNSPFMTFLAETFADPSKIGFDITKIKMDQPFISDEIDLSEFANHFNRLSEKITPDANGSVNNKGLNLNAVSATLPQILNWDQTERYALAYLHRLAVLIYLSETLYPAGQLSNIEDLMPPVGAQPTPN